MQGTRIINPKLCKRRKCRYYTNGECVLAQHYWCSNREVL